MQSECLQFVFAHVPKLLAGTSMKKALEVCEVSDTDRESSHPAQKEATKDEGKEEEQENEEEEEKEEEEEEEDDIPTPVTKHVQAPNEEGSDSQEEEGEEEELPEEDEEIETGCEKEAADATKKSDALKDCIPISSNSHVNLLMTLATVQDAKGLRRAVPLDDSLQEAAEQAAKKLKNDKSETALQAPSCTHQTQTPLHR